MLKAARLLDQVPINEAARVVCRPLVAEGSPLCVVEASDTVYDLSQRVLRSTSTPSGEQTQAIPIGNGRRSRCKAPVVLVLVSSDTTIQNRSPRLSLRYCL